MDITRPYTGDKVLRITKDNLDYINAYRKIYRFQALKLDESKIGKKLDFTEAPPCTRNHAGFGNYSYRDEISFNEFKKLTGATLQEKLKTFKI